MTRHVLAISAGSALGQLIAIAAVPALSRLYTPYQFGIYSMVTSMTLTLAAVAPLRFDLAIPLPDADHDARALIRLGLLSVCLTSALGAAVVALWGPTLAEVLRQPGLMPWLWFLPATTATAGTVMVLSQMAIRQRRYTALGRRNVLQAAALVCTQVGAGLGGTHSAGLLAGTFVGQLAGALSLIPGQRSRREVSFGQHRPDLRRALRRYWRFPVVLAPSGLLNVAGMQLPILFIGYYYGAADVGQLGLCQRVLALPVSLMGAAVAQVYLGELAAMRRSAPWRGVRLFIKASQRLALVAAFLVVGLWIAAPVAFRLVFGSSWSDSGYFAQAMALGVGLQLMAVPLSQTLIALEKQGLQFCWDAGRLIIVSGATMASAATGHTVMNTVWVFSVASALAYAASWLLSWRVIGASDPREGTLDSAHYPAA